MTFDNLGLGDEILQAVAESGYSTPTPIQEKAIPTILMGRDVLGCAQTGTGKTAGFTLPMIEILAASRAKARMPRSLIIAPTRELAAQVAESFDRYGKHHKLTKALLIGGSSLTDQEALLDRGVHVLIATPGRLLDLFERGKILLADVKILVIDEADRMMDMGFMPDVERIVSLLPKIRQTLMFSATMPPEIRRLADKFLMNPKEVAVDPPASAAETVSQYLLKVSGANKEKRAALRLLLEREEVGSALFFCNRKRDVDILFRSFKKYGYNVAALHGDLAQPVRMETLGRFKDGDIAYLVCSDVAARGLDIPAVSHVFNFDVPHNADDYVHRIGRTGRAGRSGKAFTLALPEEGKTLDAVIALVGERLETIELEGVEGWSGGAPQRQRRERSRGGRKKDAAETGSRRSERPRQSEPRSDANQREEVVTSTAGDEIGAQAPAPSRRKDPASRKTQAPRKAQASRKAEAAPRRTEKRGEADGHPFGDHMPAFMLRKVA